MQRRSVVASICAPYSAYPETVSQVGHRLPSRSFTWFFSVPWDECWDSTLYIPRPWVITHPPDFRWCVTNAINETSLSWPRNTRDTRDYKWKREFCYETFVCVRSRDSSVGIVTVYGLDDGGSNPGRSWEFFSSTPRPDRLWSLLSNGYRGLFPWGWSWPLTSI
jgi:hypothetical protein